MSHRSSEPPKSSSGISVLVRTLDDLLEHYLGILDSYTTLQEKLGKSFSSGFLSLAQANFSNQHRVHYGQDFYDERMKASLLISIDPPDATSSIFKTRTTFQVAQPSPPSETFSGDDCEDPNGTSAAEVAPAKPRNSLNWFGILVPPALKEAQCSFKTGVEDYVPQMATIAMKMREVEIEICRTRKKLEKLKSR